MPTVQIEAQLSSEELLGAVKQLDGNALEAFVDQVLMLRAERKAPHLSPQESDLLREINTGLPETTWQRHHLLEKKRMEETLTAQEQSELIQLNDRIEEDNARRLGRLAELAQLRQTTLDSVMKSLGIGSRHRV